MNTGTVTSQGVTANFGDSAFVGAVPAGFTSGFTAGASIPTNTLTTQLAAEQWLSTDPRAQLTQVAVEQWASVQSTTGQVVVSQMLIEQWASVDLPVVPSQAVRVMVLA
jgi:anti-sigma factor RsiW